MRVARAGDDWTIRVADVGIGIAGDDLPRIFDPFFTARRGGSGLGLAISKNVIEGLGGTIAATSRLGDGTTVTITLPARPPGLEVRL
jgi:signal transduction histidine kinase